MTTLLNKKINILTWLVLVTACTILLASNTYAAPVVGFEAGRIIDEVIFTNNQSMNVSQIQAFLNSKVPVCDNWGTNGATSTSRRDYFNSKGYPLPLTCLKDYTENNKSSAQIIYDTAQEFSINPQVLIVLLQKEQGLVTDDWPDPTQYRSATGYGCPDTAACDSQYYGFTNQVRWSARMFRAILNDSPTWYTPYELGDNYIQYNPNPACGGSTVNIQNRSTQALYNYTPYQPNASALNAGYGSGDGCGAHGNRNFYLYFTDWFGATHGAQEGQLVKSSSSSGIYIVENSTKRGFPSAEAFFSYSYNWSDAITISDIELDSIPNGPSMPLFNVNNRNTHLIRMGSSDGIYLVEDGTKRAFPSAEIFLSYSQDCNKIISINSNEFNLIPQGLNMQQFSTHNHDNQLIKTTSSTGIYLVENGSKRGFPSAEIFLSYSGRWQTITTISDAEFNMIPDGTSLDFNTHSRDNQLIKTTSSTGIYLVENGSKRGFPSAEIFLSYSGRWQTITTISDAEFNMIPDGTSLDFNTHSRDNQLIKTTSSTGIYLVENGSKRGFPSAEIFLSYSGRWQTITTISDAEFNMIPDGTMMVSKN